MPLFILYLKHYIEVNGNPYTQLYRLIMFLGNANS